jgi:hypothetical protein
MGSRKVYQGIFRSGNGTLVQNGTVSVLLTGTSTAANIYTSTTSATAVNSVTSDSIDGTFTFYTDDFDYGYNQGFDITLSKNGYVSKTYINVDMKSVDGTYVISTDVTLASNIYLNPTPGTMYSIASGKTLTIYSPSNIIAQPNQQIFTGTVTFTTGGVVYPEWWMINSSPGTTDMTTAIQAAISSGSGDVKFNGSYKITDNITISSTEINLFCDMKNSTTITQSVAAKAAFLITASKVNVNNLKIVGYQSSTYNQYEYGIKADGIDDTHRITDIKVTNCEISTFGAGAIYTSFVDRFTSTQNYVHDVLYSGIQARDTNYTIITDNNVKNITPGIAGLSDMSVGIAITGEYTDPKFFTIANNIIDTTTYEGILTEPAHYGSINNNTVIDCPYGISVQGMSARNAVSHHVSVSGNIIQNINLGTSCFFGLGTGGPDASHLNTDITYAGNVIEGYGNVANSMAAVHLRWNDGITFTGNKIKNSIYAGLFMRANNNSIFSNNSIDGVASGGEGGIYIVTTESANSIIENNVLNMGDLIGIRLEVDSPTLTIGYNRIITTSATPYYDNSGTYLAFWKSYSYPTQVSLTGTLTETVLVNRIIGAGSLGTIGRLRLTVGGLFVGTGASKAIKIKFGTTSVPIISGAVTSTWRIVFDLYAASDSGVQYSTWTAYNDDVVLAGRYTFSENSLTDLDLSVIGILYDTSDSIQELGFIVERW